MDNRKNHKMFTLIAFAICALVSCKNKVIPPINEFEIIHNQFESVVDSYGIRRAYEDVRWILYCIYCDDSAKRYENGTLHSYDITFGELPLKIDKLSYIGEDSLGLVFSYYYDSMELNLENVKSGGVNAAVFKKNQDTLLYLVGYGGWISNVSCDSTQFSKEDCPIREVNPLQPEVVKYIKENRNNLDPWFREEAIRRGVIKE